MDTKSAAANNPTLESPCNTTSDADIQRKHKESSVDHDFAGSATEFWNLFKGEAEGHDRARILTLKDDLDSALTFVRSYSVRAYYGLGHTDARPRRPVYFSLLSQRSYSTANKT
jgi:hypothetical protein